MQGFKPVPVIYNVMALCYKRKTITSYHRKVGSPNILHAKAVQFSNLPMSRIWCSGLYKYFWVQQGQSYFHPLLT